MLPSNALAHQLRATHNSWVPSAVRSVMPSQHSYQPQMTFEHADGASRASSNHSPEVPVVSEAAALSEAWAPWAVSVA